MSDLPCHGTKSPQNSPPSTPPNGSPPTSSPIPGDLPPKTPPGNLSPPGLNLDLSSKDEEFDAPNIPGHGMGTRNPNLLDAQELTAHLDDLKDTLTAIEEIKNASLNAQFGEDNLYCLRNPIEEELDIDDQYFRLSLDMYLIRTNVSQEMYQELVAAFLRCHLEAKGRLLSYDQIRHHVKNLTGIVPIYNDMCVNSCMAFTGPYKHFDTCIECPEPHYDQAILHSSHPTLQQWYGQETLAINDNHPHWATDPGAVEPPVQCREDGILTTSHRHPPWSNQLTRCPHRLHQGPGLSHQHHTTSQAT